MTSIRQLYEIQEIDLELARNRDLIASVASQLGDRAELDTVQRDLEAHRAVFNQLRGQQRTQDLEAETLRERVQNAEGRLYGGSIINPRELEGYEREATLLRGQLKVLDDRLLETMMALEEAQEQVRALEARYEDTEERWQSRQAELDEERKRLDEAVAALEARRQGLASSIGPQELKVYEALRLSRGGVAVARVERGLCGGCRVSLPTHQLQRARSGRETVPCNSCGRILYVG